jgi:subtilisin family serine protease
MKAGRGSCGETGTARNREDRAMLTDRRHPTSRRRPSVRALVLASALSAAVLAVGVQTSGAMVLRGNGGPHISGATNKVSTIRTPGRTTKPNWTTTSSSKLNSRLVRLPPGTNGDRPPRHPPRWPHKPPILVKFPTPSIPTGVINVNLPPPGNPSAGGGGGGGGGGAPSVAAAVTVNGSFVLDEVLVRFTASTSDQAAVIDFPRDHRLALLGVHRLPAINAVIYRYRITDQRQVPVVMGSVQGDPRVALVQPNNFYSLQDGGSAAAPAGDPMQYVVSKLHLPQAHDLATGARVLVAVIDSAIDSAHPELKGVVAGRFDAFKGDPAPHKHGTAMASAIAAHSRLLGVAPAAHILAVRAFDDQAVGARATTTRILDGLQWIAGSGARVVNMSFTGPEDASMHEMIASLRRKGLVLVAAAGNDGPRAPSAYPAAYQEVIAVTATDSDDKLLKVANQGAYVAVAAPGVDVFVAAPDGAYDFTTGTSVAAAHVSGLAALLIARNPSLTPDAVQSVLMKTAKDLGAPGRDEEFGAGLVDAYEALLTQAPATAARSVTQ